MIGLSIFICKEGPKFKILVKKQKYLTIKSKISSTQNV